MSKLIEDLKTEHAGVIAILERVKQVGITSKEAHDALVLMKNKLLHHLTKEDDGLYVMLRKAAATDEKLKTTLDFFAKDTDAISKAAADFFKKYPEGGSGVDYAIAFGALYGTITSRIRVEESILYPEYEKLPHQ